MQRFESVPDLDNYLLMLVRNWFARSPQIRTLAADLHENFINEISVAETLLPTL